MASLPCFGILKTTDTSIQFIIVKQIIHLWFIAFKRENGNAPALLPLYSPAIPLYTIKI